MPTTDGGGLGLPLLRRGGRLGRRCRDGGRLGDRRLLLLRLGLRFAVRNLQLLPRGRHEHDGRNDEAEGEADPSVVQVDRVCADLPLGFGASAEDGSPDVVPRHEDGEPDAEEGDDRQDRALAGHAPRDLRLAVQHAPEEAVLRLECIGQHAEILVHRVELLADACDRAIGAVDDVHATLQNIDVLALAGERIAGSSDERDVTRGELREQLGVRKVVEPLHASHDAEGVVELLVGDVGLTKYSDERLVATGLTHLERALQNRDAPVCALHALVGAGEAALELGVGQDLRDLADHVLVSVDRRVLIVQLAAEHLHLVLERGNTTGERGLGRSGVTHG